MGGLKAVGKDVVSRAWRKLKVDRDAWVTRDLAAEDIVRLVRGRSVQPGLEDRAVRNKPAE